MIRVVSRGGSVPAGSKLDPLAVYCTSDTVKMRGISFINE
jgi:hypothetical protein